MTSEQKVPAPPSFENLTPDTVLTETKNILTTTSGLHDDLAAKFTPSTATFNNIIRPIVDDTNRGACRLRILTTLLGQLSPDKDLRDAARQAETRVAAAQVKILIRHDIASLVGAIYDREMTAADGDLDGQDRHLLTQMHGEYLRSGSFLQGEKEREELRAVMEEIDQVRSAAQAAFTEEKGGIWFDRADLAGVPETVLESMPQQGTRIQVTFRNAHVTAVMRHAVRSETRRRFAVADQNRLPENVPRLASLVALRDKVARLLGFAHHAALKVVDKMAPSVDYVEAQLHDLHRRLKPVAQAETDRLIQLKKRHCKEPVTELYSWDRAYYLHKQSRESFSVDHELLAEYFEANHTLQGMLDVFHELFCVDFKSTVTSVWQDNVVAYEVWDALSEGGRFLGHLYVDLFDREGKYRGAHHILIQPGFVEENGEKHYPASSLVCSFARPSPSRPTLLQHSEVKTMFHELGHAIHNIVARTKYAIPHSRDFIEIPSIMLENWIWLPDVLIRLSSHFKSRKALPRELAESVARIKNINRANDILAQVQPALFDLAIHTPLTHKAALEMDTTEVWNRTKRDILTHSFGSNPQDWGAGQARFAHMFRKNDGSYFAYPLSMVIAADLFGSKFAKDPLSPEIGRRYRYQVLEPGSSRPEIDILKDFLGREPSTKSQIMTGGMLLGEPEPKPAMQSPRGHGKLIHLINHARNMGIFLLPSFIAESQTSRDNIQARPSSSPTLYLDGLRGLFSFLVFLRHFLLPWEEGLDTGFGQNGNMSFMKLPIIRLIYGGPTVPIFFIVSGFVLAYKPLKLIHKKDYSTLGLYTMSSVLRRPFRLFLPPLVSTFIVAIAVSAGLYSAPYQDMLGWVPRHPERLGSLWAQIWDWMRFVVADLTHPWSWKSPISEYDSHLWTIPIQFRASMIVYLTLLALARARVWVRGIALVFLCLYSLQQGRWEMYLFFAGVFLVERSLKSHDSFEAQSNDGGESAMIRSPLRSSLWPGILQRLLFFVGLYLSSYPRARNAGFSTPGFIGVAVKPPLSASASTAADMQLTGRTLPFDVAITVDMVAA
ncbi:hypothetical protein FANTH_10625 [Fusarium anthophilum]|uniref:Mitochondrial intermediate peptidase n=1 Tax=Fusarium anthophilum TaxID=48485 RepID=A0A8H4Z1D7_9HYPO|nr:hypothetical protein FANTH_10625 [Fusarium anthophilum]